VEEAGQLITVAGQAVTVMRVVVYTTEVLLETVTTEAWVLLAVVAALVDAAETGQTV
jgi:hypothetical protein